MEGFKLRDMRPEDLPQVHAIEESLEHSPWSMRSFAHELQSEDSILKIAEFNSQVIGYICVKILLEVAHLMKIMIIPEYRRKGIGTRLVLTCIDALRVKNSIKKLTLEVRESNPSAINFYKKLGFKIEGKRKSYYINPKEDAIIMSKEILK